MSFILKKNSLICTPLFFLVSLCVYAPTSHPLVISPHSIFCGTVKVGDKSSCYVQVENDESGSVSVELKITPGNTFLFSSGPTSEVELSLSPGEVRRVEILFTPQTAGFFSSSLTGYVKKSSVDSVLSSVIYGEGFSSSDILRVSPDRVLSGNVMKGTSISSEITLINFSSYSTLYVVEAYGADFSCPATEIPPQDKITCDFSISTDDISEKNFSHTVTFSFYISGYLESSSFVVEGTISEPVFSYGTTSFDFGGVLKGERKYFYFEFSNSGDFNLVVTGCYVEPPFYCDLESSLSVPPGEFAFIPLYFSPDSSGSSSQTAYIYSNAGVVKVHLSGVGLTNPYPALHTDRRRIHFGVIFPSDISSSKLTVENRGAQPLVITSLDVSEKNFFVGEVSLPVVIEPAGKKEFDIFFSSESQGVFSAVINLRSNDPTDPIYPIYVSGIVSSPTVFVPSKVDFGYVRVGFEKNMELFVSNDSFFPVLLSRVSSYGSRNFEVFLNFEYPFILNYGDSVSFSVSFSPDALTSYSAYINFVFLIPSKTTFSFSGMNIEEKNFSVLLTGWGGYPDIQVRTDYIDFGEVWIDERKTVIFPVDNTGTVPLNVYVSLDSAFFSVPQKSFRVFPGESFPLPISFSPSGKPGIFSSYLTLLSDDPYTPELKVKLVGEGRAFEEILVGGGGGNRNIGCYTTADPFLGIILLAVLLYFFMGKSRFFLLIIIILLTSLLLSPLHVFSFSIFHFPPSPDGRYLLSVRMADTMPSGKWRLSLYSYYMDKPLSKIVLKGEKEIRREPLINYIFSLNQGVLWSPSDSFDFYLVIPINILSWRGRNIFAFSDYFLGGKFIIYEWSLSGDEVGYDEGEVGETSHYGGDNLILSSDFFVGFPVGRKDFFLGANPFSSGVIFSLGKKNFSLNFGGLYGGEDIPLRGILSFGLKKRFGIVSPSGEIYFLLPLGDARGMLGGEAIGGLTIDIYNFDLKFAFGYPIFGGAGIPAFRVLLSAGMSIKPRREKITYDTKYFTANVKVRDEFGRTPQGKCRIFVDKLFISFESDKGEFSLRLPYGVWKIFLMCEGYRVAEEFLSRGRNNIEIEVEKVLPQIVAFSTDENGIPLERDMTIKFGDREFSLSTYYVIAKGSRNYTIYTSDGVRKEIHVKDGNIFWVKIEKSREMEQEEHYEEEDKYSGQESKDSSEDAGSEDTGELGKITEGKNMERGTGEISEEDEVEDVKAGERETSEGSGTSKFGGTKESMREFMIGRSNLERGKKTETGEGSTEKTKEVGEGNIPVEIEELSQEMIERLVPKLFAKRTAEILRRKEGIFMRKVIHSFDVNSFSIPRYAYRVLDDIADFIKKNIENIKEIWIEGYTDDFGPINWNMELSYLRAESVRRYLLDKGIVLPVKIIGFGPFFPVVKEGKNKDRNRRVEIKIFFMERKE